MHIVKPSNGHAEGNCDSVECLMVKYVAYLWILETSSNRRDL